MIEVVIVSAVRTAIGKIRGSLSTIRPDDLAGIVIKESVERIGIDPHDIEEVFMSCANQAGEDNRNVARMGALLAGLPHSVGGVTINRLCASGLNAVNQAARAIKCGEGEVYVAGGVESMTRAPYSVPKNPVGFGPSGNITSWDTTLGWRYPNPAMKQLFPLEAMGETAENIIAMSCAGDIEGGTVTAGNSSGINDGACALVLMSEAKAKELNIKPLARWLGSASAGVDPKVMGLGPTYATRKLLRRYNLSVKDIDLAELNEAFAAQAIAVIRELGLREDITNVNGGAITLGHPLGCSGARILTTLIYEMQRRAAEGKK